MFVSNRLIALFCYFGMSLNDKRFFGRYRLSIYCFEKTTL